MTGPEQAELLKAGELAEGHAPASRITIPAYVDYHMIMDWELDQLSRHETGVLASLGFVGLGALVGLVVPFALSLEKFKSDPPQPFLLSDVACAVAFSASFVLTVVCLVIAAIARRRNRGLVDDIRKRPRYGAFSSAGNAELGT
jgi:hypothetical protein